MAPTYTPAEGELGQVTLTLTATGYGLCAMAIDEMVLTILPAATANAGNDATICENSIYTVNSASATNYASLLWSHNGTGDLSGETTLTPTYTPSLNETGDVTLTLTVTGNAPCGTATDAMIIHILPSATADAGSDATICEGSDYYITGASVINSSSYEWTTSGTGTFSNINVLDPVYTPSLVDIANGSVTLTLHAAGDEPCTGASDDMTLTIVPAPTAGAGLDAQTCEGIAYTISTASADDYSSLLWTIDPITSGTLSGATTLSPTFTPAAGFTGDVTLTVTATGNTPCGSTSDHMILTVEPGPTANAGVDASVCTGSAFAVTGAMAYNYTSILWTTTGTGTLTGSTSLTPTYTPASGETVVTLTMTVYGFGGVCVTSDEMTITYNAGPTANAGSDATTCEQTAYTISTATASDYTSVLWTTNGTGTLTGSTTLAPTYTPSMGELGQVTLTLTASGYGQCATAIDEMVLTILPMATAGAGNDATICENSIYTVNSASATNYASVLWSHNGTGDLSGETTLTPTYTPGLNETGDVTLTLTVTGNAPCGTATDAMIIHILPSATADAGSDATICEGSDYYITGASVINSSSYEWTTSGTGTFSNINVLDPVYTPSLVDIANGSVTLTLHAAGDEPCTSASDEMILTIVPAPTVGAGLDASTCEGIAYVTSTASADDYSSLLWTIDPITSGTLSGATTLSPTFTPAAGFTGDVTLTLTATGNTPCGSASDHMILTVEPGPTANAGVDASVCTGSAFAVTGAMAYNFTSILWTTTGTGTLTGSTSLTPTYTPASGETVVTLTMTVYGFGGVCVTSDEMTITYNEGPTANAGSDATTCEQTAYTISTATASDYTSVLWTTNGTGTLTGSTTLAPTYTPSMGELGQVTLTLTATGYGLCATAIDEMVLTILPMATAGAGNDATICENSIYTVNSASATNYASMLWSHNGTGDLSGETTLTPTYTPSLNETGDVTLTLTVTGNAPCGTATDAMIIHIMPSATADAGSDATICEGSDYYITGASVTNSSSYEWTTSGTGTFSNDDVLDPVYTPSLVDIANGSVTLTLHASGEEPCTGASDEMILNIVPAPVADAGPDATICETSTYCLCTASAYNYNTLYWTTSGTGYFTDPNILNPSYIPSLDDIAAGCVYLVLHLTTDPPCSEVTDTMKLCISHIPIVYAGPDVTVCGNLPYTLDDAAVEYATSVTWTTSGDGTWDDQHLLNATYTAGPNDILLGHVTLSIHATACSPCPNADDSMILTFFSEYHAGSASSDQAICFNTVPDPITATPPTGGSGNSEFQWQFTTDHGSWFEITGATDLTYAPGALTTTTWYRLQQTDEECMVSVFTNEVEIIVYNEFIPGQAYSDQTICYNTVPDPVHADLPNGGQGTYNYQWQYSINGTNWFEIPGATELTYAPGALMQTTMFRLQQNDSKCGTVYTNIVTITVNPLLTGTIHTTDITCNGADDGTITITNVTGGGDGYEFSIDGGSTWSVTMSYTNLNPGYYDVWIRDAEMTSCQVYLATVTIAEPFVLDADVDHSDITCFGANNGTITISNPTGGWDGYEFSINGGSTWSVTMSYTDLTLGYYEVWIRDAANVNCMIELESFTIEQPFILDADVDHSVVTCFGANNGTITITNPTGGWDGYEFSINGGSTWSVTMSYTDLTPGYYEVWMRDAANINCMVELESFTIEEPFILDADVDHSDITCFGANNGTITISNPTGGWDGYEFSIDGGSTWSVTMSYTDLTPGYYEVWMRDAANINCMIGLENFTIDEPFILDADVDHSDITCFGANNGTITISNPTGGWDGYEFSIDGGSTWSVTMSYTDLTPGYYEVWMRDAANVNCMIGLESFTIEQPFILDADVDHSVVTCFGANNGTITITNPTGGWDGYEFSINGGSTWSVTMSYTDLTPGYYEVWMRDATNINCMIELENFTIDEPFVLDADVDHSDITCFGANDGTITISNPTGGWDGYEFSIDGGSTWSVTMIYTGLTPGSYNVWIRDAANINCVIELESFTIEQPFILDADVDHSDITCFGANNGTITITNPTGGWDGYEFSINGGSTWSVTMSYTDLTPGYYEVWMRDAVNVNCMIGLESFTIEQPFILDADVDHSDITCFGANNGTITISNPTGGWDGYEFSINGGSTWSVTMSYTDLNPGYYDVWIRDAANINCIIELEDIMIYEPELLYADIYTHDITCNGAHNGIISFYNATGGWDGYEFSIDGGTTWSATTTYTGLGLGTYDCKIRDASQIACQIDLGTVTISEPPIVVPTITGDDEVCAYTTAVYTTEAGMTDYIWTVTGAVSFSGQGTNSITIDWGTAGTGTVSVHYLQGYYQCPGEATFNVTILPRPVIHLDGPTPVCQNTDGNVYTTEAGNDRLYLDRYRRYHHRRRRNIRQHGNS